MNKYLKVLLQIKYYFTKISITYIYIIIKHLLNSKSLHVVFIIIYFKITYFYITILIYQIFSKIYHLKLMK